MIDSILASFSNVGQLFQLARPFQVNPSSPAKPNGESTVALDAAQARGRTVADQVQISPEARRAAAEAEIGFNGPEGPDGADGLEGLGSPSSSSEVEVKDLRQRDQEVRAHEAAHKAAAGQYGGSISYSYETGPDGKRYAVGGSVEIDVSPVQGDPQATIRKMQQVMRAALAPADPSPEDRQVMVQAARQLELAQAKLSAGQGEGTPGIPTGKSCPPASSNPYQSYQSSTASTASSLIDTCA